LARRAGSKPVVRYQLTVDTGTADGKRKQLSNDQNLWMILGEAA
jgi:hypothetical protein